MTTQYTYPLPPTRSETQTDSPRFRHARRRAITPYGILKEAVVMIAVSLSAILMVAVLAVIYLGGTVSIVVHGPGVTAPTTIRGCKPTPGHSCPITYR